MKEWRRPALAPVYALVTGFVVTLGAGLPTAPAGSVRVHVVGDDGHQELAGSSVEVRDAAGRPVAVDALSAAGTAELPARGGTICLRLPPQWRVVEPVLAGQCTASPVGGGTVRVAVTRDARVLVRFSPPGTAPEELTVNVQDGTGRVLESGPPDASGLYRPRTSLAGRTVCVTPPAGWTVRGADDATPGCDGVTDPHDDFRLTLVRSEDGAG